MSLERVSTMTKILAISGSLRRESFNTAILKTLGEGLSGVDFEIFPLNDVPLYDQDLDTATPPAGVAALRRAILEADGLIVASPEYNYGVSGVLKNALDWASRPYGKSALNRKPVMTLTSSPAFTGGVRAQASLHETLFAVGARPLSRAQIVVALVHEKIKDGRLADAATLGFLKAGADDLLKEIARLKVAV